MNSCEFLGTLYFQAKSLEFIFFILCFFQCHVQEVLQLSLL